MALVRDFTPVLAREADAVHGLAYLHNATVADGWRLSRYTMDEFGRLYTRDDCAALIDHLRARLSTNPKSQAFLAAMARRPVGPPRHARHSFSAQSGSSSPARAASTPSRSFTSSPRFTFAVVCRMPMSTDQ